MADHTTPGRVTERAVALPRPSGMGAIHFRASAALAALALVAVPAVAGCTSDEGHGSPDRPAGGFPAGLRLVAFDSCGRAIDGLRAAARDRVGPYGFGHYDTLGPPNDFSGRAPAAPEAATDDAPAAKSEAAPEHSDTNVQEAGVDEPDLVKTDGRRIVTVDNGTLQVVDVASRRLTGTLDLEATPGQLLTSDLLLYEDRAIVLVRYSYPYGPGPERGVVPEGDQPYDRSPRETEVLLVDLAGSQPRMAARLAMDGSYVDAREADGTVRLVTRSQPRLTFRYPGDDVSPALAEQENRAIVDRSTTRDWLPRYQLERFPTSGAPTVEGGQVPCDELVHPAHYSAEQMTTVYTFDLDKPVDDVLASGDPLTVVADTDTVYATSNTLYLAGNRLPDPNAQPERVAHTEVHKLTMPTRGRPAHVASGVVEGTLLNQYSMSEHDGRLRIVTTTAGTSAPRRWPWDAPPQAGVSETFVRVLAQRDHTLTEVGQVGGLGKDERVYAVRFVGETGYVVTFRQTDPLYTVDLSDPTRPRVVGELKIPGFSTYLHPVGKDQLIGVGESGDRPGLQVSLFDVADPARPARIAQYQVTGGSSEAEQDPHAFLYWEKTGSIVLPVRDPEPAGSDRALVLKLTGNALTEQGSVAHRGAATGPTPLRRALVIGDSLWTVSDAGVMSTSLATLAVQGWVPFG
jgi:uncharacterized secreted protein with C-terminal beta-propeller domain